ncbi:MAG: ABC transporter permease [Polyangiaceae bacterium]|nr:ABC transporter permease [Polyangiaceae bacterium]MCL4755395.1 ABC transporter permease subunit [Myxococcales bacterium]
MRRLAVRIASTLLALLVLLAVFADLIASDAPILARYRGSWLVLPVVTEPALLARIDRAELEQGGVIWAPLRASPTRDAATPQSGTQRWAQTVHGARSVVVTTLGVLALALALGVPIGALAGRGNFADALLSRAVELTGALPSLILVAALQAGRVAPSWLAFVVILGALRGVEVARLVRGEVLRVSGTEFVLAARALGGSPLRVVVRHVLPHVWGPVIVNATFGAAAVVALEAALSFVGLGLPDPVPSWGRLLGQVGSAGAWPLLGPAAGILGTTVCLYVVADFLDDRVSARRGAASRV